MSIASVSWAISRPRPPVATTLSRSRPLSSFTFLTIYSVWPIWPYTSPACMLLMVSWARMDLGLRISILGSLAAWVQRASELIPMPGAVIPAANSPFSVIRS